MILTTKITMDFLVPAPDPVVRAVQNDQYSRNLELTLLSNGIPWTPPEGTTAIVSYKKSDGTGGNYDTLPDGTTAYSISGNAVTVALAPQVLTVPGIVKLSVGFLNGTSKLYTFVIHIDVEANPGLQATSENYFKVIGAVQSSGWAANMYLGTDGSGNVVVKDAPSGDGTGGGVTFTPYVDAEGNLSWSNNGGLENPETVNIKGKDGTDGATVDEVLAAIPAVTAVDFTNFDSGSFTETIDGSTVTHAVTFDDSGRPVTIGDIAITWGD